MLSSVTLDKWTKEAMVPNNNSVHEIGKYDDLASQKEANSLTRLL